MAQISLRVDDEVKRQAEEVCAEIGMSMSTAINIYLKKLSREKKIPFEVGVDPFYSKENIHLLEKRAREMEEGKNICEHSLLEVE